MTVANFPAIEISEFNGLDTLHAIQDLSPKYASVSQNASFTRGKVGSRPGTSTSFNWGNGITDFYDQKRVYTIGQKYYLGLAQDHKLYYSTGGTATLLVSPSGNPTDFQFCTYGNLVFLFFNNGDYGVDGPYVWDYSKLPTVQVDLCTIQPEANILTRATGTLTTTGVFSNNETVTVGVPSFGLFGALSFVYTFKASLTAPQGSPYEVLIGANAAASLANLKAAINRDPATEGVTYGLQTPSAYVLFTATTLTATALTIQAQQSGSSQNGITTTEACANASWGSGTLTGGAKLDAADGTVGSCAGGYHSIRVVFETRTGYRSVPSDYRVALLRQDLGTIPLTGIPLYTGATGHVAAECTKRHIVMTTGFGDVQNEDDLLNPQTFLNAVGSTYYIALTINDNTTTTGTLNISDTQLTQQTDVSDYFQFTSPMPIGAIGTIYGERLMMCGVNADLSLGYVSEVGSPQSIRGDTGFQTVNQGDGFRPVVPFVMRGNLYWVKTLGLWATQDNGGTPDTWSTYPIAEDMGTVSYNGVSAESDEDFVIIFDFKGEYLFTGSPPQKISVNITPTFLTLRIASTPQNKVYIDTINRRVYALVCTGANTLPNQVWVADYLEGWKNVKWSIWDTAGAAWRAIVIDQPNVLIGTASITTKLLDSSATSDNGSAIDFRYRPGILQPKSFGVNHFSGLDMHAEGAGTLYNKWYGPDGTLIVSNTGFALSSAPGKDFFQWTNFRTERCFLEFGHNSASAQSTVHQFQVFARRDGTRCY